MVFLRRYKINLVSDKIVNPIDSITERQKELIENHTESEEVES